MPEDLITTVDGGEAAAAASEAVAAKGEARTLADIVAAGMKRENLDQPLAAPDPVAEAAAAAAAAGVMEEEPQSISEEELTEVESILAELGIDLGIKSSDVPLEMRPAYERLVDSAVSVAEDTLKRQLEASESTREFTAFKESVERAPDKLLLSLALKHPSLITQAAELVGQMQNDPKVRDQVLREVEVELKLQEAERRERVYNEREQRLKGAQVLSATRRAAREAGVQFSLAEQFVAMAIKATGGKVGVDDVQALVDSIKPAKLVARPKIVTPAQAAAARTVPAGALAGAQTQTPNAISPGLKDGERKHGGGGFRALVKAAMQRTVNLGGG